MFFTILWGCIFLVTSNTALLYASHLAVRRFFPDAPASVRLVAIGTLYYASIILIYQLLSPFHAITRTWVLVLCILLAAIFHLCWGKERNLHAEIGPIKSWLKEGLSSRYAFLLIACGFIVLLSFSRALLMPPLFWDSLTYHLPSAALWIKKGSLVLLRAPDVNDYSMHQINGQIFASWLLLQFHNDLLVNVMNFPITLLGGIACYAIARELGLTRKEASWAPALICFSPVIYFQITTGCTDSAIFSFCSASILFTLRYLKCGFVNDFLLAFTAIGIGLGLKYSGITLGGITVVVLTIKWLSLFRYSRLSKMMGLILLGCVILCTFGGRVYIRNTLDAGNPLYPFTVKIFGKTIFEGSYQLDEIKLWAIEYEKEEGWDKFSLWGKEYRKFLFSDFTAGPKFFAFLIIAFLSFFTKPHDVSKKIWYYLTTMWVVPIIFYYVDTDARLAIRGPFLDLSTRFLSHSLALITLQTLVVIKKFICLSKIDIILVSFVVWDLLQINKEHLREIEVIYPILAAVVLVLPILLMQGINRPTRCNTKVEMHLTSPDVTSPHWWGSSVKMWIMSLLVILMCVGGFYYLQIYRENTRYIYYRNHSDYGTILKYLADGWEFLDQPDQKKTIALTMGWKPIGGNWFFYPLLGRWLQNEIVYISSKHTKEVPTSYNRGWLRGNNPSIWLFNLKEKKVDYIFIQKPWPIEIEWIQNNKDLFELVFDHENYKIFNYLGNNSPVNMTKKQRTAKKSQRFIDHSDGTIIDTKTGLMWTKNADVAGDTVTFNEALVYVSNMNKNGYLNFTYNDWKLPTLDELRSLIDYSNKSHELPLNHPFINVQSLKFNYDTSVSYLNTNDYPRFFSLYCSLVDRNVHSCFGYLWPVRPLSSHDIDRIIHKVVYNDFTLKFAYLSAN